MARVTAQAGLLLPATLDYATIPGLRTEAREKLGRVRPETLGQAGRMAGVNPADVAILLVHVERERRQEGQAARSAAKQADRVAAQAARAVEAAAAAAAAAPPGQAAPVVARGGDERAASVGGPRGP